MSNSMIHVLDTTPKKSDSYILVSIPGGNKMPKTITAVSMLCHLGWSGGSTCEEYRHRI